MSNHTISTKTKKEKKTNNEPHEYFRHKITFRNNFPFALPKIPDEPPKLLRREFYILPDSPSSESDRITCLHVI